MGHVSTNFLRLVILGIGGLVAVFCFFAVPAIYTGWGKEYPDLDYLTYPVVLGIVTSALALFYALTQGLKLLSYIDKNKAFTKRSISALGRIKYSALLISMVYAAGLPAIYQVVQYEDAPGLMVIGMIFTVAPFTVAVFAAVCQRLLQSAIDIKSENDLTV